MVSQHDKVSVTLINMMQPHMMQQPTQFLILSPNKKLCQLTAHFWMTSGRGKFVALMCCPAQCVQGRTLEGITWTGAGVIGINSAALSRVRMF